MFTGIIKEVGKVLKLSSAAGGARLALDAGDLAVLLSPGDSLAVQGVCLTVTGLREGRVELDISAETIERTTLGRLRAGSRVNLEPALRLSDRVGGHLVSGHVDGVGTLLGRTGGGKDTLLRFGFPSRLSRYLVEKGSIALDGVSLTLSRVDDGAAEVHLIPATLERTTFSSSRVGDALNLETDLLGKYVESLLTGRSKKLSWDMLQAAGMGD